MLKVFTRKILTYIIQCERQLADSYKTGFTHRCFIVDDGLLTDLVKEYAHRSQP